MEDKYKLKIVKSVSFLKYFRLDTNETNVDNK